ncbi:MAG: hypothetical protein DRP01_02170 [Archaeoglobales archaeon]|nr:MAG: hypothetical protein DRP01_02170 [Archaeoglobales archaeon]
MTVPVTKLRTSHAITIRAGGKIVGHIQSWAPSQGKDVQPKFEINAITKGAPVEYVPGNLTTQTIQVNRLDLYTAKMEEVWGTSKPLWMLTDQHNPIDIEEKWVKLGKKGKPLFPWMDTFNTDNMLDAVGQAGKFGKALGIGATNELEGIDIGKGVDISVEKLWYSGCWFVSLGRNVQAQGDRMVQVNATLAYTKVRQLL